MWCKILLLVSWVFIIIAAILASTGVVLGVG
jgi:hypothetical protein